MRLKKLDRDTLVKIQEMVEVTFAGRDRLYSAAEHLGDEERRDICRQLAEHFAAHAVELQQILTATGNDPKEPLDIDGVVEALFESIRTQRGNEGVLDAAEEYARDVKRDFDQAIEGTPDPEARELLRSQREDVEFGEKVLRQMKRADTAPEEDSGD